MEIKSVTPVAPVVKSDNKKDHNPSNHQQNTKKKESKKKEEKVLGSSIREVAHFRDEATRKMFDVLV
jgi:hypothetical protein